MNRIGDLAKVEAQPLSQTMRESVLARVSVDHRAMAKDAISWFTDRPSAHGIDDGMGALKLAAHLSRMDVTREELMTMCFVLDQRVKFQPTVPEFLDALSEVRAEARRAEWSRYRMYRDANGNEFGCTPERAAELGLVEITRLTVDEQPAEERTA